MMTETQADKAKRLRTWRPTVLGAAAELTRLREENARLRETLDFIKTGPIASMLSAASVAPHGPDASIAVPIDLIHHWDSVVSDVLKETS